VRSEGAWQGEGGRTMASRAVRRSWWSYRSSLSKKSMACNHKTKQNLSTNVTSDFSPFNLEPRTSLGMKEWQLQRV